MGRLPVHPRTIRKGPASRALAARPWLRRLFNVARDTVTDEILAAIRMACDAEAVPRPTRSGPEDASHDPGTRLPAGGRIDRASPLSFTFDGAGYRAIAGDTLASALLANGVHLVGRSFKYHRPRGILSRRRRGAQRAGPARRAATPHRAQRARHPAVELYDGLSAASQNRWPIAALDVWARSTTGSAPLLPAGFYYKTFMWPPAAWKALRTAHPPRRRPRPAPRERRSRPLRHALRPLRRAGGRRRPGRAGGGAGRRPRPARA